MDLDIKIESVAIYCRLSREDGDTIESSSIKNQKEILLEYALKQNWHIYNTYVDDGYSGGNFNRPAFKELISDIERGKITILLTKDLSRLGRNYIETGYYTEEYFPNKNVRFIALNDNYDSTKEETTDFTPFKNIINQWYLKDLSKKIKSSNELRMKKGLLPKNLRFPLYGYKQNENNERVIDNETARVVRLIFDMFNTDYSVIEIVKYLFQNKIPCPAYYNYMTYNYNQSAWTNAKEERKYTWSRAIIQRILGNFEYAGDLVLNRKKVISYKTHKRVNTKSFDRMIFENKFEAIVSREKIIKAKEKMASRTKSEVPLDKNIYKEIVYCPFCGKALSYIFSNANKKNRTKEKTIYKCRNTKCNNYGAIRIEVIKALINKELTLLINTFLTNEEEISEFVKNYKNQDYVFNQMEQKEYDSLKQRNTKLNVLIQKVFEKNIEGEIPDDIYDEMVKKYRSELNDNKRKIEILDAKRKALPKENYQELMDDFFNKLKSIKGNDYSRKTLQHIIHKIYIYKKDNNGEIRFVFQNIPKILEAYLKCKKIEN